jgi:TRAP-type C4-dicarboxylate transport system permease small subunit
MKKLGDATDLLNRFAAVILFAMMLLTVADVALRKILSRGILGTLELTEFMMVGLVFFSLARVEMLERNITVDLIAKYMSPRIRLVWAMLTRLVCAVFFGLATVSLLVYAQAILGSHEATVDLLIPRYPFVYAAAAGCAFLAIVLLVKCLTDVRELRKTWNP